MGPRGRRGGAIGRLGVTIWTNVPACHEGRCALPNLLLRYPKKATDNQVIMGVTYCLGGPLVQRTRLPSSNEEITWLWIVVIANCGAIGMRASSTLMGEEASIGDAVRFRLRALLRCLGDRPGGEPVEQMLMDVDLDGHRYLLVRMPVAADKGISLSPREIEIVRLVAEGHPNKVIASVLEISSWTVCTHMRRVFAKFGVTSRAAMVARVAALGGIVHATLPASPRGRLQDEDDALPHLGAAVHGAADRRRASVRPIALQHRRGEPTDTNQRARRSVVAHDSIR